MPSCPGKPTLTTGFDAVLTGFFSSSTLWPNSGSDGKDARAERRRFLTLVHAEELRNKLVGEMSAGEQRRVMIGRAIAGTTDDVQMLLLDEPSNALDLAAQRDLRETLRRTGGSRGRRFC